jgi:tRNA uridine 5-carbamoylmethylation protein Kti12
MDYSKILEELNKASSFDLYRLKVAINQKLENPRRLSEIKKCLKPGQKIKYFDETENRLIEAIVLKLMRKRLLVQNTHNQEKWEIPFYFINLDDVNTDIINPLRKGLDRSQLKVGDMVGFQDKQNNDVNGKIIRLNQKTATIITTTNAKWRVAYELLHLIYDVEQGAPYLIENRPFDKK